MRSNKPRPVKNIPKKVVSKKLRSKGAPKVPPLKKCEVPLSFIASFQPDQSEPPADRKKIAGFSKVMDHGGEKLMTETGGLRETAAGKGRFDLLPMTALFRLAQHYENGAKKYGDRNWENGLPLSRFIDSAFRHLAQFLDGNRDEDHLAAILWNISGYLWTEEKIREGKLPQTLSDVPWPDSLGKP
jgi:hypothetical protein